MDTKTEDVIKLIKHCQDRLDRYVSNKSDDKILYVLKKLEKLPIRTVHLEETGVGRTVNALKKLGGEVGTTAKLLVSNWKMMVLQEEKAAEEAEAPIEEEEDLVDSAVESAPDSSYDSGNEKYQLDEIDKTLNSLRGIDTEPQENSDHERTVQINKGSCGEGSSHRSKGDKHKNEEKMRRRDKDCSIEKRFSKKRRDSSESQSSELEDRSSRKEISKRKRDSSSDSESEDERREKKDKSRSKRKQDSSDSEEDKKHKSKKSKHRRDDSSDSESNYKKHKSSKHDKESSKSKSEEKTDKHEKERKSESKLKKSEEEKHSSKHKSEKREHSKSKHESKSSRSDKSDRDKSKSHTSDKKEKEKDKHKKEETKKVEEKIKPKEAESSNSKEKSKGHSKKSEKDKSTSNSKHKSGSSSTEKIEKKHKNKPEKVEGVSNKKMINGIDSESGASFAEALGMCGFVPILKTSNSSNSIKKKSTSSSTAVEKPDSSHSSKSKSSEYRSEQLEEMETVEEYVPEALKQPHLEPLNISIDNLLPEISPNYRPLGLPIDSGPKRILTDDEALSRVMSNRNQKTKVYSGNKIRGKVETLFNLCVRILQDNIDALEYTGGVPYSILKPIMERATPDQLFNLEHHNPYLIEDTDELWQLHCQKEFRTKKREELESWREMYMRCLDEREARLTAITANIKQSQDKSLPIRTTKLAYVDSVAKPPRNIARKQLKKMLRNRLRKRRKLGSLKKMYFF